MLMYLTPVQIREFEIEKERKHIFTTMEDQHNDATVIPLSHIGSLLKLGIVLPCVLPFSSSPAQWCDDAHVT
jgi:hypothetical protein